VDKTQYTITVEKSEVIETVTRREWVRGGPDGKDGDYGYTPQVPHITTEVREVLKLRLSDLDVAALTTAALNNGKVC
jgi:hypothetical protein